MTTQAILQGALSLSFVIVGVSLLMIVWRFLSGPTLADRVVALDTLTAAAMGLIALIAIRSGFSLYIDIAVVLGLVGFLATVAFARFLITHEAQEKETQPKRPGRKRR